MLEMLDRWVIGLNGSGKTKSMKEFFEQNEGRKIYSNYPLLGEPINIEKFEKVLNEVKNEVKIPLKMDNRIEKILRGKG